MPTQEAKTHRVGEWASLRNTSPEIAEAIFEVAHYDEKLAEKIWEEGSDEVLIKAFEKTDKDSLFWANRPSNVRTYKTNAPACAGAYCYFAAVFMTLSNLSSGQKPFASTGHPFNSSVTLCAGDLSVNASALRNCRALW
ncbi:putative cytoplasmic protein [Salmonella enterica subsp. arizonae]|uniref:Putative cytoplasmic protein n=1 Tax=Salmonella enterica subsp. arizonae TaxID=59203 RepID=A0A3S4G8K0_SALER|nr:putative cytoplasmic protein [Salmonella enterica subsp. arizonae]